MLLAEVKVKRQETQIGKDLQHLSVTTSDIETLPPTTILNIYHHVTYDHIHPVQCKGIHYRKA